MLLLLAVALFLILLGIRAQVEAPLLHEFFPLALLRHGVHGAPAVDVIQNDV